MPDRHRDSQCPACIARRGLNPNILERNLPKYSSISHTIQRDSTSHTKFLHSCFFVGKLRHLQHHFFRYHLNTAGEIHLSLSDSRLRISRWAAKKFGKRAVSHSQTLRITEELVVHLEAAVFPNLQQLIFNYRDIFWFSIWRQSHHFVLAAVDLEPGVVSEGAVEQSQAVRETQ